MATLLYLHQFETPLGLMVACATEKGICLAEFVDDGLPTAGVDDLRLELGAEVILDKHPFLEALEEQMAEYFEGSRQSFDIPLHFVGTAFQQTVWQHLLEIGYGQTRSYLQQADALGNRAAIRAVARANATNRIAVVCPCHRVVGTDGSLTGYAGGLWRKKRLLMLERQCIPENLPLFRTV